MAGICSMCGRDDMYIILYREPGKKKPLGGT
jgi:hypothetical protein